MALALGQQPELLAQIESGEVHPAMAAFGLWQDEADLAELIDEIEANRHTQLVTHNRRHFERIPNLVIEDGL